MKALLKNMIVLSLLWIGFLLFSAPVHEYDNNNIEIELCNIDLEQYEEPIVEAEPTTEELPCFYETLGYYESSSNYTKVNTYGYLGKYQFSLKTLHWIGFKVDRTDFLNSPEIQEQAVRKYVSVNRKLLEPYILKYANTWYTYKGKTIYITESGILGGAHLGGHGSVRKFFDKNTNKRDAYGTSIFAYIETFSKTSI